MAQLRCFQSLWATELRRPGVAERPVPERFDQVKDAGYDGLAIDLGASDLPAAQSYVPEYTRTGLKGLVIAFPTSVEALRPALHLAKDIDAPFVIVVGKVMPLAVEDMRAAVQGIRKAATTPAQHSFWWTVEALLDAIAAGGLGPELSLKRLCGRVELELRRLCDGQGDVPDSVRNEVLYHIAKAKPVTASVRSVKAAFRLDGSLDSETSAEPDATIHADGLEAARQSVLAPRTI